MIDTHSHLSDRPLWENIDQVLERAKVAGVEKMIVPGYDPNSWQRSALLARKFEQIYIAAGIHPLFIDDIAQASLATFLAENKVVALGETGLDYANASADKVLQQNAFCQHFELAQKYDLPLIIHCRKGYQDLLAICRQFPTVRAVLHSCSASREQVKAYLDLDYFISFSGVVTRSNASKAQKLAQFVPANRILTETDSPFIGTDSCKPLKTEPAQVAEVLQVLAQLRNLDLLEIDRITTANAQAFFKI